ncbi:acyltransferase [soil metagenome]
MSLVTVPELTVHDISEKVKPVTYLSNLTPLRGVAALLTVVFHLWIQFGSALVGEGATAFNRMYLMVDFFFVLSGFIMCHVYGERFAKGVTKQAFKKFTIARFSRVYPLHLVTLLYAILLFAFTGYLGIPKDIVEIENSWYSILTNILLLHAMNLHKWFNWVHASWSISTEWWAYMIFPFLVQPFMKIGKIGKVLVCAACLAGYLVITYFLVPLVTVPPSIPFVKVDPADLSINVAYQFGIVRCLCGFLLGMMMYQGYTAGWGKKIFGNGFTMLALTIILFIGMHYQVPDIFTVSLLPLILLCGSYGSKSIDRIFSTTVLQKLGDWSFSIYLVHQPVLFTIGKIVTYLSMGNAGKTATGPPPQPTMLNAWLISAGIITLILLISSLSYRFLEVPARTWINKKAA